MDNVIHKKTTVIFFSLFLLLMVIIATGLVLFLFQPTDKQGPDQIIIIEEGMSLREVADVLEAKALIRNKTLFMLWARVMGHSRRIKAGEYMMSAQMTPRRIIEIITRGAIISHTVTIPEGYSVAQIAELFVQKGLVDKQEFLTLTVNPDFVKQCGISGRRLEGYLYPDTYRFGRGLSAKLVINTMVKRFWEMVSPYQDLLNESGMTWNEVVTLASIVEKETGREEERPIIASVFLNRLKKRMRLESDPTVIYGIEDFDGNLTRNDLSTKTPYNTYIIPGLPPGPIANPGLNAILAVLHPAQTDYVYFVSKNDGTHFFSKTLKEHDRAVRIYQKGKGRR